MKTLKEITEKAKSLKLVADKFDNMLICQNVNHEAIKELRDWCLENDIFVSDIDTKETGAEWLEDGEAEILIDPNYQNDKRIDVMDVEPDYMEPMTDKPTEGDVLCHLGIMRLAGVFIDFNDDRISISLNDRVSAYRFSEWLDCNEVKHFWNSEDIVVVFTDSLRK